jgi:hypothetical protein
MPTRHAPRGCFPEFTNATRRAEAISAEPGFATARGGDVTAPGRAISFCRWRLLAAKISEWLQEARKLHRKNKFCGRGGVPGFSVSDTARDVFRAGWINGPRISENDDARRRGCDSDRRKRESCTEKSDSEERGLHVPRRMRGSIYQTSIAATDRASGM